MITSGKILQKNKMCSNKEYKDIYESWRNFINENINVPDVMSIIRKIKILEKEIENCKSGKKLVIEYLEDSENICILNIKKHEDINIQGKIKFEKTQPSEKSGYALGGYKIIETYQTTKGFGPLLYEIIIEKVSELGSYLISDRSKVSTAALNVWNIYNNRNDIKKRQLDINTGESEYLGINQLTTKIDDDTSMQVAIKDRGEEDWHESALSKAYHKERNNLIVLDYLRQSKYIDFIDEKVDEHDEEVYYN